MAVKDLTKTDKAQKITKNKQTKTVKSCGHGIWAYDGNSGFLNSNHDLILVSEYEIREILFTHRAPPQLRGV